MKSKKLIPSYAVVPLILVLLVNCLTYFGTRPFTQHLLHHNMKIFLDDWIPFCPEFISIYILSYVFWVVGFILIARENKQICYRFLSAEIIAKLVCLFFFIVYPTTLARPVLEGNLGFWEQLTKLIYDHDAANNLFPSIHCLESWICFRGAMYLKKVPKWYLPFSFIAAILVFLSTVFVKQHVVIDIIGAVFVVEIGIFITGKLKCFE